MIHYVLLLSLLAPGSLGQSEYVDCIPGTLNVILGAPHGGDEEPSHIPTRDAGCWDDGECIYRHDCGTKDFDRCSVVTTKDMHTQELTRFMRDDLFALFGEYPTISVNLLHRRKMDANREINEAAFGEHDAEVAWHDFQDCISAARDAIEEAPEYNGMGIFFDIHGHGHPNDWAELGYLISGSNLDNDNFHKDDTSIRSLGDYVEAEHGMDFDDLLRGETSFGNFIEALGVESVPSTTNPGPGGESYFSGGYNTRAHGSRDRGSIDAIQIESARVHRDDTEWYAELLSQAIYDYVLEHYPQTIKNKK